MGHKIKLTGYVASKLRALEGYYSFDMEEKGGNPAKGLPASSTITYTVFANQSQLDKAGITAENLQEHKLFIEGEPCLDVPMDICPGEIGVSCTQIMFVPAKGENSNSLKNKEKSVKTVNSMPEYDYFVPVEYVVLPEVLPMQANCDITKIIEFIKINGFVDRPVHVRFKAGRLCIHNGFAQYYASIEAGLDKVPVKLQQLSKKYVPEETDNIMPMDDIIIPEEFLKFVPSRHKLNGVIDYFEHNSMIPSPVLIDGNSKMLIDGYSKYYAMKMLEIPYIPVKFKK